MFRVFIIIIAIELALPTREGWLILTNVSYVVGFKEEGKEAKREKGVNYIHTGSWLRNNQPAIFYMAKKPYRSLISLLRARSRLQPDPERHQKPKVKLPLTFVVIDKIAYRRAQLCHFWGYCFWLITNGWYCHIGFPPFFDLPVPFSVFFKRVSTCPIWTWGVILMMR